MPKGIYPRKEKHIKQSIENLKGANKAHSQAAIDRRPERFLIAASYLKFQSTYKCADKFDVTHQTFRKWMRHYGIPRNPVGGDRRSENYGKER